MNAFLKLILLCCIVGFSGCAIIENEDPEEKVEAYFFPACGPADGPAIESFFPSTTPLACENVLPALYQQPWRESFTRVYIYQFPEDDPDLSFTTYYFYTNR